MACHHSHTRTRRRDFLSSKPHGCWKPTSMIIAFLTLQQLEDQGECFSQQQATRPATTGYVKASTAFVAYHFALKAQLNLLLPPCTVSFMQFLLKIKQNTIFSFIIWCVMHIQISVAAWCFNKPYMVEGVLHCDYVGDVIFYKPVSTCKVLRDLQKSG